MKAIAAAALLGPLAAGCASGEVHYSLTQPATKHRPAIEASVDADCVYAWNCVGRIAEAAERMTPFVDATSYAANPEWRPVYVDPTMVYMLPRVN